MSANPFQMSSDLREQPAAVSDSSYGQILKASSILGGTQVLVYLISLFKNKAAVVVGGWECQVSVDSVADALVALMSCSDSELADRGRRARRLAESNYTWTKLAADLHAACESLIARLV